MFMTERHIWADVKMLKINFCILQLYLIINMLKLQVCFFFFNKVHCFKHLLFMIMIINGQVLIVNFFLKNKGAEELTKKGIFWHIYGKEDTKRLMRHVIMVLKRVEWLDHAETLVDAQARVLSFFPITCKLHFMWYSIGYIKDTPCLVKD